MISFLRKMLGFITMTPEEQKVVVDRLQEANKVLRKAIFFGGIYDMFYRRKAKLMTWVPNRINGQKVNKTKSMLAIKRRFGPDHIKARVYKATFRGICGAMTWQDIDREISIITGANNPAFPIVQPNTPRLRLDHTPRKWERPRQIRKREDRVRNAELAFKNQPTRFEMLEA